MWLDAILWWAVLATLGIAVLPIVERIFPATFPDRGYPFAKPLALVVFGYLAWVTTSIGIPHRVSLGIMLVAVAATAAFGWRQRAEKASLATLAREEAIFVLPFVAFVGVRALQPEIFGAEKYMDFAFFNTLRRAEHFPPQDPWMSGVSAAYYYFSYLLFANLARITGIAAAVGYNLSLATIGAVAAATAVSIGTRLSGRRWGGALAAVALCGIGNLDAARQLFLEGRGLTDFDYWRPTRVVPNTINEFPFFSWMHGDLHSHVTALVIVVALIGVALAACDGAADEPRLTRANALRLVVVALLLGALSVTNPWDVPVYLTLLGLCALECLWDDQQWLRAFARIAALLAVLAVAMVVLALPFTLHFQAQFQGIGRVHARTALVPFFTVFGFLLLPAIVRLGGRVVKELRANPRTRDLAIAAGTFAVAVLYVALQSTVLLLCVGLTTVALLEILDPRDGRGHEPRGAIVLVATAAVAIGAAELVFLRDPYGEEMHRMNTVFKLYFQGWVLLALAFGPLAVGIIESSGRLVRGTARTVLAVGLAASLCYPVCALELRRRAMLDGFSLDGMAYLDRDHPDDAAAIRWLDAAASGLPVVVEATGDPYSYYARVSANTGLPTLIGWANHEGVWRGADPRIAARIRDVDRLYTAARAADLEKLLADYRVRYVFFGELERQRYSAGALDRLHAFPELLTTVYRSGETEVLEVRVTTASE